MTVIDQPRVPAGREGGGRFATKACPAVYALLDTLAPQEQEQRPEGGWAVPAPKCPHGHFARWAAGTNERGVPNCGRCASGR